MGEKDLIEQYERPRGVKVFSKDGATGFVVEMRGEMATTVVTLKIGKLEGTLEFKPDVWASIAAAMVPRPRRRSKKGTQ